MRTCIRRARAMGSLVEIIVVGGDAHRTAGDLLVRLDRLEARWSRFRPDSEVTALNAAAGRDVRVSHETVTLVRTAVSAWRATGGAFDPTLLGALVRLGYDRSRSGPGRTLLPAGTSRIGRPGLIEAEDDRVRLPPGTAFDPGGIGKGLAADLLVTDALAAGADGVLVSVGGDLRAAGAPPHADRWRVDVAPVPGDAPVRVELAGGAVATSTERRRRWRPGRGCASATTGPLHDGRLHHLLEPRDGSPTGRTSEDSASCTVIAGTGAWAEAFATAGMVRPPGRALGELHDRGLAGRLVGRDGVVRCTPAWATFEAVAT